MRKPRHDSHRNEVAISPEYPNLIIAQSVPQQNTLQTKKRGVSQLLSFFVSLKSYNPKEKAILSTMQR